ncbi:two component transcriptional regulator, LuxR family [Saccharicrinis carchari]|uniref:Two component transcriptional regulator, LuxR family n=1 Tax=Saccharicrinis carchari TaxID=1168039 RepID=A0A521AST8_SACCC|nr:response regulator transcription factor [Saccharicrinis carchari]SMO37918.1 two component transcriptional regulator, LuxR family [Saccharicrinis carchari]
MIKLLIVDDHFLIREGLKKTLKTETDILVIGELVKGAEVCDFIRNKECDLIILDINLPDRNGLDVLKDVKAIKPNIHVLMLSVNPEKDFAVRTIKAGAAGYITKDRAPEELIKAIRKSVNSGRYISEQLGEKLARDLESGFSEKLHEKLSDREFQVLCLIGSGKSSKEIATNLALGISTVNTYKSRIFEKMNFESTSQLIHYVIKNNL